MNNLITQISNSLKSLRKQRNWSLDKTSQETGVSKAMLGQIERGESSPTIAVLWKIVTGFKVPFSFFIKDIQTNQFNSSHHKSSLKQICKQDDKIKIMPLFAYDEILNFEVFIVELLPGSEYLSQSHQRGVIEHIMGVIEHIIVTKGQIEVKIDNIWHKIKEQEGLRFDADKEHGYRNQSSTLAVFHNIIHYNK